MADVFRALGDPTRRAIVDALVERDGQTLFELCSRLAMGHFRASTRQAVSQHLDILEAAGLVVVERSGRYKLHYLRLGPLEAAVAPWLGETRRTGPGDPVPHSEEPS
jgi:DNA-binding transcriptional ArsR family regulator